MPQLRCNNCTYIATNKFNIKFIQKKGVCRDCYILNKGIVKHRNHYVPWGYQNYGGIKKDIPIREDFEDVNAKLPKIIWCTVYNKWKIEFDSPDRGGNNVQDFVWYFDSKEEIFEALLSG